MSKRLGPTSAPAIGRVFEALSDPTRRGVVELLVEGPRRAGELAGAVGTTAPTMSRHLKVLLAAGLVADDRPAEDARVRMFRLRPETVGALQAWLDQIQAHWDEQLQSYKRHVEKRTTR